MSERRSPNDPPGSQPTSQPAGPRALTEEEVARLWEQFKGGNIARCPRDEAPLALAVDGAAKSYRLVCTRCGNSSLWFEAAPAGPLQVHPVDEPPPGPTADD